MTPKSNKRRCAAWVGAANRKRWSPWSASWRPKWAKIRRWRGRARGLVRLTGKNLPPDPQKWNEVVQAGVTIAPEPTWVENAIHNAAFWEQK